MINIKLKDYKGNYVGTYDDLQNVLFIEKNDIDEIKKYVEKGRIIYGSTEQPIFTKNFSNDVKDFFKDFADDNGYEDINDFIDYDNNLFGEIEKAINNWIENLGDENNIYFIDKNVIIEL